MPVRHWLGAYSISVLDSVILFSVAMFGRHSAVLTSMHEGALRSLEFDRIVKAVQSFALTPLGAAQLTHLQPLTDTRRAQVALAATSECVRYVQANAPLPLQAPADLDRILTNLAVEGQPLEANQLRGLADFLSSVGAVRRALAQADDGPFPALRTVLEGCRAFEAEVSEVRAKTDEAGTVVDEASQALQTTRERLRKQRTRLRGTLDSYLRGKDTARHLQEQVITERGGRFVLVVKTEHRGAIPGIVHGSSGSGASLFLEPLSTVEINNDIVALGQDEAAEVRRILLTLANAFRKRALDLRHTLTAATEIDVIQARAAFSQLVDGVEPELVVDTRIELLQARHPLLIPAVRRRLAGDHGAEHPEPVPVDVRLIPPISVLVITGPNTGGKTVALKTAGLLTLMAQAGLHVPAAKGSRLSVVRTVFADIGDEQSIAASLSTFSGHMSNIVSMDRHLALPALLLLDEVGAGTDPVEGGALGVAIIEYFRARGALVVATTHDDVLKSYAATTSGVACASFGFDPDTFAPNYTLTYGAPGRSLALEIAARLGVSPSIIEAARNRRSARESQLADHLAKIDSDMRALEAERDKVEAGRKQLTADRIQLDTDLEKLCDQQDTVRRRLSESLDAHRRDARTEIDRIVDQFRLRASELGQAAAERSAAGGPALTTSEAGSLRAAARTALDETIDRAQESYEQDAPSAIAEHSPTAAPATPPPVGSHVTVHSLGLKGTVLAVHKAEAEVEVRGKRLHVQVTDLRLVAGGESAVPAGGRVTTQVVGSAEPLHDLNVIGCTVDEALSRTEKYLDQAVVHEQQELRVIHGHGKGELRRAIAALLGTHPQVAQFTAAKREHGGGGVTVIKLKD